MDWTRSIGSLLNSATDATVRFDVIAIPGTMRYSGPRQYSIAGIMPTSMEPSCSNTAHRDGGSKRSSNRSERFSRP
jgi:hypothetical protein